MVGPTGSGKSSLIGDIEQLSQEDSFSRRKILVNGEEPSYEDRTNPRKKNGGPAFPEHEFLGGHDCGRISKFTCQVPWGQQQMCECSY
nr:hypothetical protein [Methanobacterium formicicum]